MDEKEGPSPAKKARVAGTVSDTATAAPANTRAASNLLEQYEIDDTKKYGLPGAYGFTVAARDKETGEDLAVKVIDMRKSHALGKRTAHLKIIQKECEILTRLKHASCTNIIDIKAHCHRGENEYLIFMELASGGDLHTYVMEHTVIYESEAHKLFIQLLCALKTCHLLGVAHRDLKLENVVLTSSRAVKLIDFGLSHVYARASDGSIDRSTQLFEKCGTLKYAAPEVLGANKTFGYCGFGADVWSLGVCLFTMVSGFYPLDEASLRARRFTELHEKQVRNENASTTQIVHDFYGRPTTHLSRELVDLLDHLLLIDPSRRISLDDVAKHPWVKGSAQQPGPAPVPVYTADGDEDGPPVYRSCFPSCGASNSSETMPQSEPPELTRQLGQSDLGAHG